MVDAVPVDSIEEAAKIQVQIGGSVFAIARDDSFIAVKTVGVNGKDNFDVFDKRPPAAPAPAPEYLTREEVETMIAAAIKRPARKAAEE